MYGGFFSMFAEATTENEVCSHGLCSDRGSLWRIRDIMQKAGAALAELVIPAWHGRCPQAAAS